MSQLIDILIEGLLDEAVAHKLISYSGHTPGVSFGKRGLGYLQQRLPGFNARASYGSPILVLVDFMDTGLDCPPAVAAQWMPERSTRLLLRVAVREIESWLLADREGMAGFLGLSPALLPGSPETLRDPKQTLVNLARRSRRKAVRAALAPAPGISATVGPEYVATLQEFVAKQWRIEAARTVAPSLDRCLVRLAEL